MHSRTVSNEVLHGPLVYQIQTQRIKLPEHCLCVNCVGRLRELGWDCAWFSLRNVKIASLIFHTVWRKTLGDQPKNELCNYTAWWYTGLTLVPGTELILDTYTMRWYYDQPQCNSVIIVDVELLSFLRLGVICWTVVNFWLRGIFLHSEIQQDRFLFSVCGLAGFSLQAWNRGQENTLAYKGQSDRKLIILPTVYYMCVEDRGVTRTLI